MSFLRSDTPEELRAAVEAGSDPISQLLADAEVCATAEASRFIRSKGDNRWLLADPFVAESVASATSFEGFRTEPEPGRAIIVPAAGFSIPEPGEDTPYGWRSWRYLSDVWLCDIQPGTEALCHRCTPPRALWNEGESHRKRIEGVFHIARGRFVVEFALCAGCSDYAIGQRP